MYWEGMKWDIQRWVAECPVCQQNKSSLLALASLLQPLPIPQQIWDDISMDFIEGLPSSKGWDSILVVVDRLSKYGHFIGLRHTYSAITVAATFTKEVVRLHNMPNSIVSDQDKVFMSRFWGELFRLQGTVLKHSTAYHTQTNRQTEVVNRCLETYLRCFANSKPQSWARFLPWAEFWYNSSYHTSSWLTPFRSVYGCDPPSIIRYNAGTTPPSEVKKQLVERDEMLVELRQQLHWAQQRMKKSADAHRREVQFDVGTMVYLKLRPYRCRSLATRANEKLAPRFYSPYHVVAQVGAVTYKLLLPPEATIHPIFHVSQLRRVVGSTPISTDTPSHLMDDFELQVEPEAVRGFRVAPDQDGHGLEVLIKWKNLIELESSWESYELIQNQFPAFHLVDKVSLGAEGIDKPPIRFTYARRAKRA